jgi:hypothetical protein
MSMTKMKNPDYEGFRKSTDKDVREQELRTKQAFKDSCDINKILYQAQKTGTISHLQKHGGIYGDFTDIDDLLTAHAKLQRGQEIFDDLPSEIKREFNQNAGEFFKYVNAPENKDDLARLLPGLAKQGTQRPDVLKKAAQATAGASLGVDPTPPPAEQAASATADPAPPTGGTASQ